MKRTKNQESIETRFDSVILLNELILILLSFSQVVVLVARTAILSILAHANWRGIVIGFVIVFSGSSTAALWHDAFRRSSIPRAR